MNNDKLFDNYQPLPKTEWIKKATEDLKGKDFKSLQWKTVDDITIHPFYTPEDVVGNVYPWEFFVNMKNDKTVPWENLEKIVVKNEKEANQVALKALNFGSDGIIFDISVEKPDLKILLQNILLQYCTVYFSGSVDISKAYMGHAHDLKIPVKDLQGGLLTSSFKAEGFKQFIVDNGINGFKLLFVNASWENNPNSCTEPLVDALKKITVFLHTLTDQGVEAKTVLDNLIVQFHIGNSYFLEICKLRAFRILLAGIAAAYEISDFDPASIHLHCQTIVNTTDDKNKNLIRNTPEAMAAILGGCNSLYTAPHEPVEVSDFSRRIARNVSLILKEEAYLDKVANPAAGSFYIENLTSELAEKAWNNFVYAAK